MAKTATVDAFMPLLVCFSASSSCFWSNAAFVVASDSAFADSVFCALSFSRDFCRSEFAFCILSRLSLCALLMESMFFLFSSLSLSSDSLFCFWSFFMFSLFCLRMSSFCF